MLKPIFLCADDFGLNTAINEGILTLGLQGRLSATSCMSLAPAFARDATTLAQTPLATGLHLSLTEPGASHMASQRLPKVILRSELHQWSRATLHDEIRRQLDAFEDGMQRPPHHVDGHQHIHALPMIRDVLLQELVHRYPGRLPVLRSTRKGGGAPSGKDAFKACVIEALGAQRLLAKARHLGFPTTHALLGVYDFKATPEVYLQYLQAWAQCARPDDLIMCHPALTRWPGDALGSQRQLEYEVLSSSAWEDWLEKAGLRTTVGMPTMCT